MKSTNTFKAISIFGYGLFILMVFMALGLALEQPFRTKPALATLGILVSTLVLFLYAVNGHTKAMAITTIMGWVSYFVTAIALGNILVSLIWMKTPWYPAISAWLIVIGIFFAATHEVRDAASAEIAIIERVREEGQNAHVDDKQKSGPWPAV